MSDRDVLVVDDNPGDVRFIEEAFKRSRLSPTVHTRRTEDEALDFVRRRNGYEDAPAVDVALLDWNPSRANDEEVRQAIDAAAPGLPVVVMSGSETELTRVKSAVPRATRHITKPTRPEPYIEVLRPYLTGE